MASTSSNNKKPAELMETIRKSASNFPIMGCGLSTLRIKNFPANQLKQGETLDSDCLVVLLSRKLNDTEQKVVPSEFQGLRVVSEVVGLVTAAHSNTELDDIPDI
mmetsp:Transcript_3370/g.4629  ORF Transcript_3370/g.4629 Transcript_3370/m.4629 type:complete len:105 (+) Transcript_3370:152-466(+)